MWVTRPAFCLGGDFKCLREEGVAGQHGDAFAEDFVIRGLAPAEIVVVHRGQIVVDERVGVDALDGAGQRQGVRHGAAARLGRREHEGRPHAFAAGEDRVAHRLVNSGGLGRFLGEKFVEGAIDRDAAHVEVTRQIK